jgi:uncharacterized repeat protein (TIGR03803 family)
MRRMAKWIIAVVIGIGVTRGQTITVLHAFTGRMGLIPRQVCSETLYGSTGWGEAYGWGTIFKVETNNKETVLYSYAGRKEIKPLKA